MGEIAGAAAAAMSCCSPAIFGGKCGGGGGNRSSRSTLKLKTWVSMVELKKRAHQFSSYPPPAAAATKTRASSATQSSKDNNVAKKSQPPGLVTFTSSSVSTNVPFYEPPGVSFDEYLMDRPRIFRAMFPDKRRSERLNDDEWRIQMLPLQFLFASVNPVVVMRLRCKSDGEDYPPAIPASVARVLELQATRWELRGLDDVYMPSNFGLSVQGLLYSERNGDHQSLLKGRLELGISLVLPPVLALVPMDVLRSAAELVLNGLVDKMKDEVHGGLLSDFRLFGREKQMKPGTLAQSSAVATTDQIL